MKHLRNIIFDLGGVLVDIDNVIDYPLYPDYININEFISGSAEWANTYINKNVTK